MDYPHLIEDTHEYWLEEYKGYCCGIIPKHCHLKDAEWMRESYQTETRCESEIDKALRLDWERAVSAALIRDKVIAIELRWGKQEEPI